MLSLRLGSGEFVYAGSMAFGPARSARGSCFIAAALCLMKYILLFQVQDKQFNLDW